MYKKAKQRAGAGSVCVSCCHVQERPSPFAFFCANWALNPNTFPLCILLHELGARQGTKPEKYSACASEVGPVGESVSRVRVWFVNQCHVCVSPHRTTHAHAHRNSHSNTRIHTHKHTLGHADTPAKLLARADAREIYSVCSRNDRMCSLPARLLARVAVYWSLPAHA